MRSSVTDNNIHDCLTAKSGEIGKQIFLTSSITEEQILLSNCSHNNNSFLLPEVGLIVQLPRAIVKGTSVLRIVVRA